jgi:hypothetical protein
MQKYMLMVDEEHIHGPMLAHMPRMGRLRVGRVAGDVVWLKRGHIERKRHMVMTVTYVKGTSRGFSE